MLRWNQILRELVARYNLPPAPRDNGTYPAPGRRQPVRRSRVPLRQPALRGARLQLRLGGAVRGAEGRLVLQVPVQPAGALPGRQRRPVPDARRPTSPPIPPRTPCSPACPPRCCGCCSRRRSRRSRGRRREQREAALLSGRAAASDIAAGLALGRAVAAVFTARAAARTACGNAVGTPRAVGRVRGRRRGAGRDPLDEPRDRRPRPPMLPFFGQVRPWTMTAGRHRAGAPGSASVHVAPRRCSRSWPR